MNTLDKLFSRELNRRTGAHAINIYIESATKKRQRTRSAGAKALSATKTTTKVTTQRQNHSFFHRLNIRFPWLKLVAVLAIGIVMLADMLDLTISKVNDPFITARVAPMSKHLRATERTFEGKKLVALTFDDGPSPETTPKLLDILHEKDVLATFFVLGNQARNNPDVIKRAAKEHHEIGSHTMYHQNLIRIPVSAAESDINEAKSIIKNILGHEPSYTRPPYGNYNETVQKIANTPLIIWSVDSEDWRTKDPSAILATTMSEVHDGAIILMHDIYPTTVEAVPTVIDTLRQNGYEFVTIPELKKARRIELKKGEAYYNLTP